MLADVTKAAGATHAELVVAAMADPAIDEIVRGTLASATRDSMQEGPVVVGAAQLARGTDDDTNLAVDMALALPASDATLVLRTLAVTSATAPPVPTTVSASVGGTTVGVSLEPELDRVVLDLGRPHPDGVVVRIQMAAVVPDVRDELVPRDGPGSYGLFSDQGDVVVLGHWLPVPVAVPDNDGDVPPWGDLGAFAPATWFLDVEVDEGFVHTGATDYRSVEAGHQEAVGAGLRDVAAVWVKSADGGDMAWADADGGGVDAATVRAWAGAGSAAGVSDLSAAQLSWFTGLLGPLPWTEHDVVRVDMDLAAGMEFPGMVFIDDDLWAPSQPPGRYVLAHEWAHQWFHAFVGNGSLSDPVVDEPLAQYLSWRWFLGTGGAAAGDAAFARSIDDGGEASPQPPGTAAADFSTAKAYSTAIYRTAASAWVEATGDHGLDTVDAAVVALVREWGLREASEEDLLDTVAGVAPGLAADLRTVFDGG